MAGRHMRQEQSPTMDATPAKQAPARRHRAADIVVSLVVLALLAAGIAFLLWPRITNNQTQQAADDQIQVVRDLQDEDARTDEQTAQLQEAWDYLNAYNEDVREGKVTQINDPWGFSSEAPGFLATELPDGLVGEIRIPVMDVDLPIYLGSTEENMYKGATVMYGMSAPLGQPSSNCVIAAHRGYTNGYMFNYIERLKPGDHVYVSTPWEKDMDYVVRGFQVVDPDDTAALKVEEGRDLVTLLTCHPHPQHTHRLLVTCERTTDSPADADDSATATTTDEDLSSIVPVTSDETTVLGMNLLDFQDLMTNVALVVAGVLVVLTLVRLVRAIRG